MPFKLGTTDITKMELGTADVTKLMLGTNLVWSSFTPVTPIIGGRTATAPRSGSTSTASSSATISHHWDMIAGDYQVTVIVLNGSGLTTTPAGYTAHLSNQVFGVNRKVSVFGRFVTASDITAGTSLVSFNTSTASWQATTYYVQGNTINPTTPVQLVTNNAQASSGTTITSPSTTTTTNLTSVLFFSSFSRTNTTTGTTTWTGGPTELSDVANNLTSANHNLSFAMLNRPTAGLVPTATATSSTSGSYRNMGVLVFNPRTS